VGVEDDGDSVVMEEKSAEVGRRSMEEEDGANDLATRLPVLFDDDDDNDDDDDDTNAAAR